MFDQNWVRATWEPKRSKLETLLWELTSLALGCPGLAPPVNAFWRRTTLTILRTGDVFFQAIHAQEHVAVLGCLLALFVSIALLGVVAGGDCLELKITGVTLRWRGSGFEEGIRKSAENAFPSCGHLDFKWVFRAGLHVRRKHKHKRTFLFLLRLCLRRPGSHVAYSCVVRSCKSAFILKMTNTRPAVS